MAYDIDQILDSIAAGRKLGYSVFGIRADLRKLEAGTELGNSTHEGCDGIVAELDGACSFDATQLESAITEAIRYADGEATLYLIAGHTKNAGILAEESEDLEGNILPAGFEYGLPEGENAICIPGAVVLGAL
jgi:hypothetical protein